MSRPWRRVLLALVGLLLVCAGRPAALAVDLSAGVSAPRYRLEPTGFPVFNGRVTGFNDANEAVYFRIRFVSEGFWWDGEQEVMLDSGSSLTGVALDINEASLKSGFILSRGRPEAALWDNGVLDILGTFGGTGSSADAVNDNGLVAGWFETSRFNSQRRLFTWQDGVFEDLGVPPSTIATAEAVNDAGLIVGHSDGSLLQGWLWDGEQFISLPDLEGGNDTTPRDINNAGVVVGQSNVGQSDSRAVTWIDGVVDELPVPTTTTFSRASSINDHGVIVGEAVVQNPNREAVVWIGGEYFELDDLVVNLGGTQLQSASFVNNNGVVLASGISPEGRLLQYNLIPVPVPEPSALTLATAAGLVFWGRRRRRRWRGR